METPDPYLQVPKSNGNPREQALIRRWWHKDQSARGRIVWEYYLGNCYLDAVWFPNSGDVDAQVSGKNSSKTYPIRNADVVLCEAKIRLTPELIGQALVYGTFARRAGAKVHSIIIFAESGSEEMRRAAEDLGLHVIIRKAS